MILKTGGMKNFFFFLFIENMMRQKVESFFMFSQFFVAYKDE
jgi:hypothetical protein